MPKFDKFDGLTYKQSKFVYEYVIDFNATQAAKRAGYSEHTASEQSAHLLGNVRIKQAIQALWQESVKDVDVTVQQIVTLLLKEAMDDSEGSSKGARVQALTQLGRYKAMFTDNAIVNVTGLDVKMREAEARIAAEQAEQVADKPEPANKGE